MENFNNDSNENLNDDVDFDFFDDKISEISNSNNNAIEKTSNSEIRKSISNTSVVRDKDASSKHDSVEKLKSPKVDVSDDESSNDTSVVNSDNSSISIPSKSSKYSEKRESNKSPRSYEKSKSRSSKLSDSSLQKSSRKASNSESDVTSISSLDSGNSIPIVNKEKPPKKFIKPIQQSKYHTHFQSSDDIDMIPTEVILQAMMRIHEERRLVQKMKPKWVDPNTKDYSFSGITTKLNLVPDKIVSMPKKNIRSNPFYFRDAEIEKRLYHNAINRNKEKDRIDRENIEMGIRLRKIRPSPGITKEELLKEYSKMNRFSNTQKSKPRVASSTPTCRPQSSNYSNSGMKIRRTNSSTIVSRFADSRQSNSRKSEPERVMSANSLTSNSTRHSNTYHLLRK